MATKLDQFQSLVDSAFEEHAIAIRVVTHPNGSGGSQRHRSGHHPGGYMIAQIPSDDFGMASATISAHIADSESVNRLRRGNKPLVDLSVVFPYQGPFTDEVVIRIHLLLELRKFMSDPLFVRNMIEVSRDTPPSFNGGHR